MHNIQGGPKRIAIVGGGISGLGAAWALRHTHDVTVFEKEGRLGGHADTQTIGYDGQPIDVDTGFIVYNTHNYPNLVRLFDHLGVETTPSDMSFAVSDPNAFEWSSNGFNGIFAWKRNLANPSFVGMLSDIVRFSASARQDLEHGRVADISLADYVAQLKLGQTFLNQYLIPMGAAIWSTPEREMLRYPALSFLRFFDNHRLLHSERPRWRTVKGGSKAYVAALAHILGDRVRKSHPVVAIERADDCVTVVTRGGGRATFDEVILACHSDEALAILGDASEQERALLGAIRYEPNTAWLHRDPRLMPRRPSAWASWNYMRAAGAEGRVCVTYWMNLLQGIDRAKPVFVTLNPETPPSPELTFGRYAYSHPQFNAEALAARNAIEAAQGARRTWFAGAWLGNGFHEDGLSSGLRVARRLGGATPWRAEEPPMSEKARAA
ncbi:MAG: FAD-dependent oxidoreductase [Hyphomonadaceae bacterium]|nr:FAD-dependent oxidoreductase [Hyphomonadaceae bacterium]